jgi:hypothetical protein
MIPSRTASSQARPAREPGLSVSPSSTTRALALLLGAAALCAAACKSSEAPPAAPAAPTGPAKPTQVLEHEPNDAQHAQGVPERSVVLGSLAPPAKGKPDDDWYRVTPGPGLLLALRIELVQSEPVAGAAPNAGAPALLPREPLNAALEVYDRDRNPLLKARGTFAEPALLAAVACFEACFVRVSGITPTDYRLTILGAPPAAGQELEPNDRAVDATPLAAGAAITGSYGYEGDEDWFKLSGAPKPGQYLRVELSGVDGVRPELELRAASDGALLATFRAPAAGDALFVRDLALGQGDAPPAPAPMPAAAPAPSAPAATPTPSAAPPANALPEAAPAAPAVPPAAPTAPPAAPPALAAAPTSTPPGAAPVPEAPTAANATSTAAAPAPSTALASAATSTPADAAATPAPTVAAAAPPPPPAPAAAAPAPQAAPAGPVPLYYLVVRSGLLPAAKGEKARRAVKPQIPYTLQATLENGPAGLELEPNDEPARATPLTDKRTGYLSGPGDVDWYRLHADAPGLLRVEVTALERADLELSVWLPGATPADKPKLLARANEGGVREGEALPSVGVPAGDVLIKLESAARDIGGTWTRDGEDRTTAYTLTATLAPDDGSHDKEPNDDLEHAQPVTLPLKLTGTIWPRKDVDTFRFHVDAGAPPVNIRVSALRGVDLQLTLQQLKAGKGGRTLAEVIGTADAVHGEGEESILQVPLKAGDYAVSVSSPRGRDASATQVYTLTVAAPAPAPDPVLPP